MTQIFVFPAGDEAAQRNLERSIARPISGKLILDYFREADPQELPRLERVHREANGFYAWGTKPSDDGGNEGAWEAMEEDDYVLAYYRGAYHYVSSLLAKYDEPDLARAIWEDPDEEAYGETWRYMYFLTKPVKIDAPTRWVAANLGLSNKEYRRFARVSPRKVRAVIDAHGGSIHSFIDRLLDRREDGADGSAISVTSTVGKPLRLYEDYSREEVHYIFAPDTAFTPQSGTWGLQGIVPIPDRPGDFVFFVTLGQEQAGHVFDEGITEDGVLTWQSQPRQGLSHPQIREFIEHDELRNAIYLFLRTRRGAEYTYLGELAYLSHDTERENPVYFQWQVLEWEPPSEVLERMGLILQPITHEGVSVGPAASDRLEQTPTPPARTSRGTGTRTFKARKLPDFSAAESRNRDLGLKGELLVVEHEKRRLAENGRPDLAERVRHVSVIEGDGAGYDIESFTPEGETKYIEVKTTSQPVGASFFISPNELEFANQHSENYYLYRVYDYRNDRNSGRFYVENGDLEEMFELTPTQYRAVRLG
jgi:uncharacterized protein DUF3883/uncharacterized protein DUF3427